MLTLKESDITLNQAFDNKTKAIESIAQQLSSSELVASGYVQGMLQREQQNSTYLGNGIAIPHGTTDTRDLVNKTGVAIHHYPKGVEWGDGNTVYVAIGIAAKSDEHLSILKQLTKVLASDGVESKLKSAKTKQDIIAVLTGKVQLEFDFDASLIQTLFPASDMLQMCAVAGGLLKNSGNAGAEFVADIITKSPTSLGKGLWLVSSNSSVSRTGMSVVTTANDCQYEGQPVKGLIAFSACNDSHLPALNKLTTLIAQGKQNVLLESTPEQLISLFKSEQLHVDVNLSGQANSAGNTAVFAIKNAHGLHARPGAMLVAEAKKFESDIRVSNLDSESSPVNAKSLMKVIALGVKHGHKLQFSATGSDAEQALVAIGKAIESGLGEG
ncbi:fused PTS fructose transporter subunit IIA/HPr protein [Vibrio sp. SCSIO 43135]|uniref:fused PTS fructose transporter subunit IIA/HPr protein n=1 Tax=Vibrio sp. SCSIO 43135 TaxID=2819096 RepID=UPI00207500DE|nr:fused PTS fructose transporter subunit IIA/HPr protein [Vibrio sp. SCSIO 43135]USD44036.1 fused PTS fructose transporter subunit IIA/HPr protein [Vibrio sp. SCSIO 43135]